MANNMEKEVLRSQVLALKAGLQRVYDMVSHGMLAPENRPVYGKFYSAINPRQHRLVELEKRIDQGSLEEIWQEFAMIKDEAQRVFDQCLEFFGGLAVRKWDLGKAGEWCELAERLVSHYVQKTGAPPHSIMIVGEERPIDAVARTTQIIRIRFPEWDIWSLPLTIHELGQLVAVHHDALELRGYSMEEERRLQWLLESDAVEANDLAGCSDEILRLRARFQPSEVAADIIAFLKKYPGEKGEMVRRLVMRDGLTEKDMRDKHPGIIELRKKHQRSPAVMEVNHFLEQQHFHLPCLFGDIFSTYFLGPAYPYARLYLRLIPSEISREQPFAPSMDKRMAYMLLTLQNMNEEAKKQYSDGPYSGELKRLEDLWKETVKPWRPECRPRDLACNLGKPYDDWFKEMYEKIKSTFTGAGLASGDWQMARNLSDRISEGQTPAKGEPLSFSTILNAAWLCRHRQPGRLADIEREVITLLKEAQQEPSGGQAIAKT